MTIKVLDFDNSRKTSIESVDTAQKEEILGRKWSKLIHEQGERKLSYVLARVKNKKKEKALFDAFYLEEWFKKSNKNPITKVPIEKVKYFYLNHPHDSSFKYLGTRILPSSADFITTFLAANSPYIDSEKRVQAQYQLALYYEEGNEVEQSYEEAIKWYRLAAELPEAQLNLGYCYEKGNGVPQSYAKAMHWYHLAAKKGLPEAQFNLAVYYEEAPGLQPNPKKAHKWYQLAAAQGHKEAQEALKAMHSSKKQRTQ